MAQNHFQKQQTAEFYRQHLNYSLKNSQQTNANVAEFSMSEKKAARLKKSVEKDLEKLNAELDAVNQRLEMIQDKESKEYKKLLKKKQRLDQEIYSKKYWYYSMDQYIRKK